MSENRQSQFIDGTRPGLKEVTEAQGGEQAYSQPDIEVSSEGEGGKIEDGSQSNICQVFADQSGSWFARHKDKMLIGLAVYGGYRLLKRKK